MSDLLALDAPEARALTAPPGGRQWAFSVCWRGPLAQRGVQVAELIDARSRKLHLDLYGPCTAEFVIDGRAAQAALVAELSQDLVVQRFDPTGGRGWTTLFRGPFARTQDTVSATVHTVNYAAADYRAMLGRTVLGAPLNPTNVDQSLIVSQIIAGVSQGVSPSWSDLGLVFACRNPDDTNLAATGVLRTRAYTGAEKMGDLITNLSQVINGFDWAAVPTAMGSQPTATVTVWYPQRGTVKPFLAEYGATVGSLTRTVNSTDFANWVRVDGTNTSPGVPVYAVAQGDIVANPQLHPEGLWEAQQSAADVSQGTTLQQQADGYLALHSQVVPSYTVHLVPGAWNGPSDCWLGDTIRLRVNSGRLAVDTSLRVVGVDFDINDNGQERVALVVGRSDIDFGDVMAANRTRLDALSRR